MRRKQAEYCGRRCATTEDVTMDASIVLVLAQDGITNGAIYALLALAEIQSNPKVLEAYLGGIVA